MLQRVMINYWVILALTILSICFQSSLFTYIHNVLILSLHLFFKILHLILMIEFDLDLKKKEQLLFYVMSHVMMNVSSFQMR